MQQQSDLRSSAYPARLRNGWLWAAGAIFFIGVAAGTASLITRDIPQPHAPDLPRNAQLVDRASATHTSTVAKALRDFEQARNDVDRRYFERLSEGDRAAAKLGASTKILAETLRLKATDQLRREDNARKYLDSCLTPSIDAVRQDYLNELASALTHLDLALEKATVALSFDLASEKPSSDRRAIPMPESNASAEAPSSLKLGVVIALGAVDAVAVSRIAGKVFVKQIGRLVALPLMVMADGPLVFGDILAIAFAGWTAWDIYHLRSQYERELLEQLGKDRTAFVNSVAASINQEAGTIRDRALAARDEIMSKVEPRTAVTKRSIP